MCHPEHMYDVEAHSNTHAHTQINVTVISENNLKRYHESYNDSSRAIFIHVE